MLLWFAGGAFVAVLLVFRSPALDYRAVMLGSLLPLLDLPFGGARFAHTLLAPVLVLVWVSRNAYLDRYAEPDKGWSDRDEARWSAPYWYVDAGMAAQNVLLAAVAQGLGACFFGIPAQRISAVRAAFGVPADQLSVGVISLGHPAAGEQPSGSPRRRPRARRTCCASS